MFVNVLIHALSLCRLLCKNHCRWNLKYVDVSGCSNVTDLTLQRLAQSFSPISSCSSTHCLPASASHPQSTTGQWKDEGGGGGVGYGVCRPQPQLRCLILSGCSSVTDVGLRQVTVNLCVNKECE